VSLSAASAVASAARTPPRWSGQRSSWGPDTTGHRRHRRAADGRRPCTHRRAGARSSLVDVSRERVFAATGGTTKYRSRPGSLRDAEGTMSYQQVEEEFCRCPPSSTAADDPRGSPGPRLPRRVARARQYRVPQGRHTARRSNAGAMFASCRTDDPMAFLGFGRPSTIATKNKHLRIRTSQRCNSFAQAGP
jgi:hypothetical protein